MSKNKTENAVIKYLILSHLTTSYSSYFGGKKGISRNKTSFFLLMTHHRGVVVSPLPLCCCGAAFAVTSSCHCRVAFAITSPQCRLCHCVVMVSPSPSRHHGVAFAIALLWCHLHRCIVAVSPSRGQLFDLSACQHNKKST